MRRASSQKLFDIVRDVLLKHWDPIDIGDNENLYDEYDEYIPQLIKLVGSGCSEKEIVDHLQNIEEMLGLHLSKERRTRAAAHLMVIR